MDKKRLFSIGKLSKLTGAHVQSLRYYESLGILSPAYVDPDSQYRYYTFSQTRIVEAIQYCAELDIPLKQFRAFLSEEDGQIDYSGLLDLGKRTAQEKMRRIQERLDFLERMQGDMRHAEACRAQGAVTAVLPERLCWAIPYEGTQTDPTFHAAMYRLISQVERHGLHAGFDNGLLLRRTDQGTETFRFIDLREGEEVLRQHPQVVRIPGGTYRCTVSGESRVKKAPDLFPQLFPPGGRGIAVEVELFTQPFRYSAPVFELRCFAENGS